MSESASPPEKDGARCEPGGSRCPACNAPARDHRADLAGTGKVYALRDECVLFPGGACFCSKAFDRGVQYTDGGAVDDRPLCGSEHHLEGGSWSNVGGAKPDQEESCRELRRFMDEATAAYEKLAPPPPVVVSPEWPRAIVGRMVQALQPTWRFGVDLGYDPPVVVALPDPPCWPCYNGEPHERGATCPRPKP